MTLEDFECISELIHLYDPVRTALRLRAVDRCSDEEIERELRRERDTFRMSSIQQEIEDAETALRGWIWSRSRYVEAQWLLDVIRGPRQGNPTTPNYQPSEYDGSLAAVALRSPLVIPADVVHCWRPPYARVYADE